VGCWVFWCFFFLKSSFDAVSNSWLAGFLKKPASVSGVEEMALILNSMQLFQYFCQKVPGLTLLGPISRFSCLHLCSCESKTESGSVKQSHWKV